MVEIEIHFGITKGTMVETRTFVGIYRGIESFRGFLGGAGFRPSTVGCLIGTHAVEVFDAWMVLQRTAIDSSGSCLCAATHFMAKEVDVLGEHFP